MSVVGTILVNAAPIGILALPFLFLRNRGIWNKIYQRFYLGAIFFFGIYLVLPCIFQLGPTYGDLNNPT